MKWLIWREYRLNRPTLITGAVFLLLPYLVILIAGWWSEAPGSDANAFVGAAFYSLIFSQLIVAVLGGNAFAGERADRSAEFIAYLPLSRTRLLGSKLSLAFSTTALIWGTNLLVLWIVASLVPELWQQYYTHRFPFILSNIAITSMAFFGVSWFISSFQSSPTFAVLGGLITPLLVLMVLHAAAWAIDMDDRSVYQFVESGFLIICPILAVVCFSIGTWYYLHRVEP